MLVDEDGAGKSKILAGSSSTNNLFISWLSNVTFGSRLGSHPGPFVWSLDKKSETKKNLNSN